MTDLKRCPCGKVPERVSITDQGSGSRYRVGIPNCCDEWMFEFRCDYQHQGTPEELTLAEDAWNNMPRGDNEK